LPTFKEKVKVKHMQAMHEVDRPYYDPTGYKYLKEAIERDGFKKADAVFGRWNKSIKKYEIFSGTHRLKIAKQLGIAVIPMWDYSGEINRSQAIAEGIKENLSHVSYNPMDRALALQKLSKRLLKSEDGKQEGRRPTMALEKVASLTGLTDDTVRNYLTLLRLPMHTQRLVGHGKLRLRQAILFAKLIGIEKEKKINMLAAKASKGHWPPSLVERIIKARLSGKEYIPACRVCRREADSLDKISLCKHCLRFVEKLAKTRSLRKAKANPHHLRGD
jgi:hypothetical protein